MADPAMATSRAMDQGPEPGATNASDAVPPPYPCPGWGDGDPAPEGYRYVWRRADARWSVYDGYTRLCRFTVGPGHSTCGRSVIALLNRSHNPARPNLWGYCERHLYGRHIHDGAVWQAQLVPQEADRG